LYYYLNLMVTMRQAIADGRFAAFCQAFYQNRHEGGNTRG
jgi:queuine/archaeosine tRNA-ribosyltransferase